MSDGPFIRLEHITQRFGKVTALDDVSIEIPARRTIGLIGPDGVGKSTMLALVTGALAAPSGGGDITVLGGDMRDKAHRTKVPCPLHRYHRTTCDVRRSRSTCAGRTSWRHSDILAGHSAP